MRVLILTQYFRPEPALKFADLARGLRERGHDVQVITGFPCYPQGRTYTGYRQRLYTEELQDGLLVTRLPQIPDHSRSAFRRALYYLSFALSVATIGLWRSRKADVILVYQSAMPIGLAAWIVSRVKRIPYVLDVVDLWPESVAASGIMRNRLAFAIIRKAMQFIYRGAARINVITEGYRDNLMELGIPAKKMSLIHCWPGTGLFDPLPRDPKIGDNFGLSGRFNIVYAGTMGPVQDLRTVIEAALLLRDQPDVQFIMIGDGVEHADLMRHAERVGATNVRFLGRKTPEELQKIYPWADALLVHLKTDPMSRISIPSKTFAYMAAGRPILMAVEGEASRLVEKHGCGVAVRPSDPGALAKAVRQFRGLGSGERDRMGKRGRKAYSENYSSPIQLAKFEKLLEGQVTANDKRAGTFYRRRGKRIFDVSLALILLAGLAPVMLVVAALIRINLGRPILFRQTRPGRNGKLFELIKFRTMHETYDLQGQPLSDELRLTRFGKFLRATSLDELPELWNVLRGDMSFVGPRPLLTEYLSLYTPEQAKRHEVEPGITGLAQVNGRNIICWDDRFEYDVQYVDGLSVGLDLKILARTLVCVVRRKGISAEGHATCPAFEGSSNRPGDDSIMAA